MNEWKCWSRSDCKQWRRESFASVLSPVCCEELFHPPFLGLAFTFLLWYEELLHPLLLRLVFTFFFVVWVWGPLPSPFPWTCFYFSFVEWGTLPHTPLFFLPAQDGILKKDIVNRRYRMKGSYLNIYSIICSWGNMEIAQLLCRDDDENW